MTALEATEVLKKEVLTMPREFVSPFIDATDSGPALTELLDRQPPSLLKELLTEPTAIAERMLDPAQAARAMGQTSVMLIGASALTGGLLASLSGANILQAAFLLPVALVLSIGAAMGPVAGTAVMAGARIPWQLLAAALTTAVTAGALTMVALVPVAVVLWRINSEWAGPLSVVSAFIISGYVSGRRIRTMLDSLARIVCERTSTPVEGEAVERIKLVGRVALVQLSFTMSLAVWALKVLG
jgi:hypothetical protein